LEYGLTDKGFIVKPFNAILREEQVAFQTAFGMDIDLSDESIEGVYIKNQSLKLSQLWELLGKLYMIGDVDDSFGVYLDRLINFVNVRRTPASATQVYECLWAEEGTVLRKGHLLRMKNGVTFKLTVDITVGRDFLLGFQLIVTEAAAGHTYQFLLDTHTVSYTALAGDAEAEINAGLVVALEIIFPNKYEADNQGTDGLFVHAKNGGIPFTIASDDRLLGFPLLGAFSRYECTKTGAVVVSIGALNEIVSKIKGLESVVNYASGITGRDMESDTEVRMNLAARQKQATANEIAIQNAILDISGVEYAKVYSNRDIIEVDRRPPKCYEAVIVGGDEQEIAETIFAKAPAGIQAFGNIVKTVKDAEGFDWQVGFSRPTEKYIWIKIACSRNIEETFASNWIDQITDNIEDWASASLGVAVDLIYQKLFRPVYDVQGVGFADIKVAVTNDLVPPATEAYQSANIIIGEVEIGLVDRIRITITELET
jgi:uncharacterized phage protein gp47/JayE